MLLNRTAPSTESNDPPQKKYAMPTIDEFIEARDYTGCLTLLKYIDVPNKQQWQAYCYFYLQKYEEASEIYTKLLKDCPREVQFALYLAICLFMLGRWKEADGFANKAAPSKLQNRVLFHIAHKLNDEKRLMTFHQNLQDVVEDQMALASIHYLRGHYQEAIEIYKKILLENREYVALNVYVALCYYKLEYFDVSNEVINVYLQFVGNSLTALNLRACNNYKLFTSAVSDLAGLPDNELIEHNKCVFKNGESGLLVFTKLIHVIPEAKLNLTIYYLKSGQTMNAFNLLKDVDPNNPHEYILKAIVNAVYGQEFDSKEHVKIAQQYFQLVGGSASECDTIPGRQCMASCFFLLRQFEDVLIYLNSIKAYFYSDDSFLYNLGQAQCAQGSFAEAQEAFLAIQSQPIRNEYTYLSHLARCYIMNKDPKSAWELFSRMETSGESINLLQLVAHDCYRKEFFYYSAKAFDTLSRLDPSPSHSDALIGAVCGTFKAIVDGQEDVDLLRELLAMLSSPKGSVSKKDQIKGMIRNWAADLNILI